MKKLGQESFQENKTEHNILESCLAMKPLIRRFFKDF